MGTRPKGFGGGGSGGDGSTFRPTKSNLYPAVKAILHPASNPGVSADDANKELDIAGGGDSGWNFKGGWTRDGGGNYNVGDVVFSQLPETAGSPAANDGFNNYVYARCSITHLKSASPDPAVAADLTDESTQDTARLAWFVTGFHHGAPDSVKYITKSGGNINFIDRSGNTVESIPDPLTPLILKAWQDAMASTAPPGDAQEETAYANGGLVPIRFQRLTGTRYIHFEVPDDYAIDLIAVGNVNTFDDFTLDSSGMDVSRYHSARLSQSGALNALVRVVESG